MVDPLPGRTRQMSMLQSALDDVRAGSGAAIAFVGEPGTGKSALLWAAANAARAAGVPVEAVRGVDLTRDPDLNALSDRLLDPDGPWLVSVDDAHLLGADEAGLIGRLLRCAENGPVLCLLSYRRRQLDPRLATVLADFSAGPLRLAPLEPLTLEQAADLLRGRPDAEEIHREAEGVPQYIKVLTSLRETGGAAEAGSAIFGELAGLDPDALAAAQAAAVLGEPHPVALLAEVAGIEEPAAVRALDLLTRLDLVRPAERGPRLALRHRAVAEAVYERLEPSLRLTLHRRAETALARIGAPVAERARHVARAADPERPEHLTTLIAAARAVLYTSPSGAAESLQVALPLLREGDGHGHEVHVLLARARVLSGEFAEGRALLDALRSNAAPETPDGGAELNSSRIERRLGRHREAGALARSGLAALAETDSATAAALHIELADGAYDNQDYRTSLMHAETAAEIAARHGDRVGEAHALAQSALAHLFTEDEATALARATAAADLVDASPDTALLTNLDAPLQLGMTEGILGRLADSERHLARAEVLARGTGQTYVEGSLLTVLANAQLRLGKLEPAIVVLERARQGTEQRGGNPSEEAVNANLRAAALFWRAGPGDAELSARAADRAYAVAVEWSTTWAVVCRCFHAETVLLAGDPVRARSLLLDALGEDLSGITPWRRPRWCDTLGEAALAVGDAAAAEHWAALAESAPQRPPGMRAFGLRAAMWAHAARGGHEQALRCAREATREFASRGERIEVCRTLLAAARFALDAGLTQDVPVWLDRVTVIAEASGSARLLAEAAACRARLAAPVEAPQASDALSPREREIADLVSTGMTNVAIAGKLYLSVRTVETHLRQIYRKLDVPNRAALTRVLLESRPEPRRAR
ncbi:MAG TPA: LuxR C-terminal-related transcriptional regulator [Actinospica sp.]|nr:LuxR C-terminal-related transcriptional regulator [Actinospica sp.]